jgi:HK97 family phage prohead protease
LERLTFGVADAKFESGVFTGRVHAYGTVTVDGRQHGFRPGIFQSSIASGKVRAYWGHESVLRLGSQKAGTLRLEDTGQAVDFALKPPKTSYAQDLQALVESGEEIGVSFEFIPGKYEKQGDVRIWTEGRLDQINFVENPAFQGTSVVLNSAQGESVASQLLKARARVSRKVYASL